MSTRGRKKKSTEEHRLTGTYQECRHGGNADIVFAELLPIPDKISLPKPIAALEDKEIKKAFKEHVRMLIKLKSLYAVDIPSLVNLYLILNDIHRLRDALEKIKVGSDEYLQAQDLYLKMIKTFDTLGGKFYLTPQVRNQMKLGDLQIISEQLKLQKQLQSANPIDKLITQKKN